MYAIIRIYNRMCYLLNHGIIAVLSIAVSVSTYYLTKNILALLPFLFKQPKLNASIEEGG